MCRKSIVSRLASRMDAVKLSIQGYKIMSCNAFATCFHGGGGFTFMSACWMYSLHFCTLLDHVNVCHWHFPQGWAASKRNQIFLPNFLIQFPLSPVHDSHQARKAKAITRFLRGTQSQPTASFRNACSHNTSITYSNQSAPYHIRELTDPMIG